MLFDELGFLHLGLVVQLPDPFNLVFRYAIQGLRDALLSHIRREVHDVKPSPLALLFTSELELQSSVRQEIVDVVEDFTVIGNDIHAFGTHSDFNVDRFHNSSCSSSGVGSRLNPLLPGCASSTFCLAPAGALGWLLGHAS